MDIWINDGFAWTIDYMDGEYINMSIYNPLSRSTYIELPNEIKKPKKGLINIKNNDHKCFLWCHVRHLNHRNKNAQRITKKDKKFVDTLDYKDINFPVYKKGYKKIEKKNDICLNVFCYEDGMTYPVLMSEQKFGECMDLLSINDENKSHCVYIKDFDKFLFNKTKHKNKKHFWQILFTML